LLDEVERVSDHVALIDRGRVVVTAPLDDLKAAHERLTLRFEQARTAPPELAGALAWEGAGHEWTVLRARDAGEPAAAACGARGVSRGTPSLDEIFVARVGTRRAAQ